MNDHNEAGLDEPTSPTTHGPPSQLHNATGGFRVSGNGGGRETVPVSDQRVRNPQQEEVVT